MMLQKLNLVSHGNPLFEEYYEEFTHIFTLGVELDVHEIELVMPY